MTRTAIRGYPVQLRTFEVWRGDARSVVLRFTKTNRTVDPPVVTKIDLSGFGSSWAAQLRQEVDSPTGVAWAVDPQFISDPDDPRLILSLTGEQTAALERRDITAPYGFDVQASGGAESPFTVWWGQFTVDGDYTHE